MTEPMTIEQAREFIASVPWTAVKQVAAPDSPIQAPPDPHEYIVNQLPEVHPPQFWAFVALIEAEGYRADRPLITRYLQIDDHVYWAIPPRMINRTPTDAIQHEPLPRRKP